MDILAIIVFFIMMWGFGFTFTRFVNESLSSIEKNVMRIALGIGFFVVISNLFNVFRIPLNWWIFFILSIIAPLIYLIKNKSFKSIKIKKFKLKKSTLYFILVLLMFFFTLFMYVKGSFIYSYYEDGDPWLHAGISKYIALEKTAFEPIEGVELFHYVDPYPPGYDILLGMLYQISGNLIWVVKFFNSLLIALGIIFFYFFVKRLTKDSNKALFATFVLTMIPCYMSHFIWAHTLVIVLIYPFLYSLEMIEKDKKWWIVVACIFAAIALSQPTQAFKIGIIFSIYLIIKLLLDRRYIKEYFFAGVSAICLAFLSWWGYVWLKYGSILGGFKQEIQAHLSEGINLKIPGSADRVYSFSDFFIARSQNMINNPTGVGVVLMLLCNILDHPSNIPTFPHQ